MNAMGHDVSMSDPTTIEATTSDPARVVVPGAAPEGLSEPPLSRPEDRLQPANSHHLEPEPKVRSPSGRDDTRSRTSWCGSCSVPLSP